MGESAVAIEDLFKRGLGGDARAYRDALSALTSRLRQFFRARLSGRGDDVEDLLQETLIAVHNQRHTYDPSLPLGAWLNAIARYKLIDWLRSRQGASRVDLDAADAAGWLAAAGDEDASDARRDIATLLEALPARHREPIRAVKVDGLSVAEAALKLGMSESAIKVGVHRGIKALGKRLGVVQ